MERVDNLESQMRTHVTSPNPAPTPRPEEIYAELTTQIEARIFNQVCAWEQAMLSKTQGEIEGKMTQVTQALQRKFDIGKGSEKKREEEIMAQVREITKRVEVLRGEQEVVAPLHPLRRPDGSHDPYAFHPDLAAEQQEVGPQATEWRTTSSRRPAKGPEGLGPEDMPVLIGQQIVPHKTRPHGKERVHQGEIYADPESDESPPGAPHIWLDPRCRIPRNHPVDR